MTPEGDFQRQIRDLAKLLGWKAYRPSPSRGMKNPSPDSRGWPDVTFVRGDRMVCLELKAQGGKPTIEQLDWIAALDAIPGVQARVAWPSDLNELARVLA